MFVGVMGDRAQRLVVNVIHIDVIVDVILTSSIFILLHIVLHIFPDEVAIISNGRWQPRLGHPVRWYTQLYLHHTVVAFL